MKPSKTDPAASRTGLDESHGGLLRGLHNFFDTLPAEAQHDLNAVSSERSVARGQVFRRAGERPAAVYQLRSGRVKYSACDAQGRDVVLTFMCPGDWIGLSELFSGLAAAWDVTALAPVQLRVIQRADFELQMARHPAVAAQLLRIFSLRFSLFQVFGLDHSALTLKERVMKTLYLLSFSHDGNVGPGDPILLPISQEELSKVVGSSRQKLNAALKTLAQEGLVEVQFGGLRLPSRRRIVEQYGHLMSLPPAGSLSPG